MFLYCYPVQQRSDELPSSRACRRWDFWHCNGRSFAHFPPKTKYNQKHKLLKENSAV